MEQIETLHAGNFRIIQDTETFRFGIDAVLLADFASAKLSPKTSHIVDLCTGNGIVPLLLAARIFANGRELVASSDRRALSAAAETEREPAATPERHELRALGENPTKNTPENTAQTVRTLNALHITGVEIQHQAADMARRSVALNNLENLIEIIECDVKNIFSALPKNCADVVTANPPYMPFAHGKKCPSEALSIARHEVLCCLEDVVRAAAGLLNSNGRFFMIHRPERLAEIMESLVRNELEPKRLRFIHAYADTPPTMVLIEAKKCAAHGLVVEKPLVVYSGKKVYSPEMQRIYGRV